MIFIREVDIKRTRIFPLLLIVNSSSTSRRLKRHKMRGSHQWNNCYSTFWSVSQLSYRIFSPLNFSFALDLITLVGTPYMEHHHLTMWHLSVHYYSLFLTLFISVSHFFPTFPSHPEMECVIFQVHSWWKRRYQSRCINEGINGLMVQQVVWSTFYGSFVILFWHLLIV